ncbi:putative ubiquitin protein [Thermochaetoides thermophila DSM 1495]|uniref:Putative ubiquitin protein n=1 Tax=Chaetomium thermophilum (strain DSM 1495 / CBS 144.50 / IMI 039719) TaxID=759272 RepID=G0SCP1_CHATD|nr:putative ubiquitin protein [Thermochaetoides thermophila DSM 1495]EGS19167.1 putative ubiquitin protein [Thermochaetoides thermophila DSM 1495]
MASAAATSRGAMRRLMKELDTWTNVESLTEEGIERLGPVNDDELLEWEAVINGKGVGYGYDNGRWLLRITIPPTYPLHPPTIKFVTPIVHANVNLQTGEICLDLLKDAWTPAYSILECVRAIRMLLSTPGIDSPLNVDVAALLRDGDTIAARRLVELWVDEERYEGK